MPETAMSSVHQVREGVVRLHPTEVVNIMAVYPVDPMERRPLRLGWVIRWTSTLLGWLPNRDAAPTPVDPDWNPAHSLDECLSALIRHRQANPVVPQVLAPTVAALPPPREGQCPACGVKVVYLPGHDGKELPCEAAEVQVLTDTGQAVKGWLPHRERCPQLSRRKRP